MVRFFLMPVTSLWVSYTGRVKWHSHLTHK